MPVYQYKCKDCSSEFEVRHSMSFDSQKCVDCESLNVFKIPCLLSNKIVKDSSTVGKIVDSFIEDTKQEIRKEKKKMREKKI